MHAGAICKTQALLPMNIPIDSMNFIESVMKTQHDRYRVSYQHRVSRRPVQLICCTCSAYFPHVAVGMFHVLVSVKIAA